jgi:hypothetical protein
VTGRALEPVRAVRFDGAWLRGKCDLDAELGAALLGRFSQVLVARLQAARLRLTEVYGTRTPVAAGARRMRDRQVERTRGLYLSRCGSSASGPRVSRTQST